MVPERPLSESTLDWDWHAGSAQSQINSSQLKFGATHSPLVLPRGAGALSGMPGIGVAARAACVGVIVSDVIHSLGWRNNSIFLNHEHTSCLCFGRSG